MDNCFEWWKEKLENETETCFKEARKEDDNKIMLKNFEANISNNKNSILFAVSNAKLSEGFPFNIF